MGFSLKIFFEGLQELLSDTHLSDQEKLEALRAYVENNRAYAEECGQLRS